MLRLSAAVHWLPSSLRVRLTGIWASLGKIGSVGWRREFNDLDSRDRRIRESRVDGEAYQPPDFFALKPRLPSSSSSNWT
jgi:hypothetical protein